MNEKSKKEKNKLQNATQQRNSGALRRRRSIVILSLLSFRIKTNINWKKHYYVHLLLFSLLIFVFIHSAYSFVFSISTLKCTQIATN